MMKRYDHLCLLIKITLRSEEREREECPFLQLHVMYLGTSLGCSGVKEVDVHPDHANRRSAAHRDMPRPAGPPH